MARSLATSDIGHDAPILCLHDAVSTSAAFAGLAGLARRHRIVAWDAPGFGRAVSAEPPETLADYADLAREHARAQGPGPFHLLAVGWGVLVALQIAAQHPADVRSLVLAGGTVGLASDPSLADAAYGPVDAEFDALKEAVAQRLLSADAPSPARELLAADLDGGIGEAGYRRAVQTIRASDLSAQSRTLRTPALVLCGDRDRMLGVAESQRVSTAVPQAVFVTVSQAAHLLPLDKPAAFEAWAGSFLDIVDHVRGEGRR